MIFSQLRPMFKIPVIYKCEKVVTVGAAKQKSTMIEMQPIQEKDHPAILAVAETLSEWFDADARGRAIPMDLRHQEGFVIAAGKGSAPGSWARPKSSGDSMG